MNFGVSSRSRSLRSAATASVLAARSKKRTGLRLNLGRSSSAPGVADRNLRARSMTARAPLCKALNLRFNCRRLLYGFGFRTPPDDRPLVGQQGDQGSDNENRAADPDPRREWVIKCLDNGFFAIGCRSREYNIDVASVEVAKAVVNRDD